MAIRYQNLDLLIERSGTGYLARVLESPAGEGFVQFDIPFTQAEVENIFIEISHSRLIESPEAKRIHSFGQALFESIFKDEVRDRLRTSLGEANKQGEGLRLRLRFTGTSELGNLPWEFMYDPSLSRFLALSVDTPIVRYLEIPQVIQPLAIQPPLRILAMICSPKNYPRLDVEREWQNLQEAMSDLQKRGLVEIQRLTPPTLPALQQSLRRDQFHIFHFIGHGAFSSTAQDGLLLLEDERREGYRLSGRDLGTLLHDHRPLRLAVLNACEGARTSSEDQFAGTAQSLMQQGLPAVIAMQFRITDQAAIVLAHEFYGALADGYPVDAALTEARKAIKTQGNDLEWGTPVLYMRSPSGQIFEIGSRPQTERPPFVPAPDPREAARLERLHTEALEAFYLGKWEEASNRLQEVVDSQPNYKDAATKLEIARRKLRLQILDEGAAAAEKSGDWNRAVEELGKLLAEDATFPNATARLAKAKREKQLADLYAEARQLAGAEKWQAVLELFREIDNVNPRNSDPQGLRLLAEKSLTREKKEKELETNYAAALSALDAGQWSDAVRHLRRVRGLQAGYRETESLLRRAESEIERARQVARKPKVEAKVEVRKEKSARAEWLLAGLTLAILISHILAQSFGNYIQTIWPASGSNPILITSIYMFPTGLVTGLVLWWFLSKAYGPLRRGEIGFLLLTCVLAETVLVDIGISLPVSNQVWFWTLNWAIIWLLIGIPIAMILRRIEPGIQKIEILKVVLGWCLGYVIGVVAGNNLRGGLIETLGDESGYVISVYIEQSIGALIGGWVTLRQTKIRFGEIKTPEGIVLATAAEFALSRALTETTVGGPVYDWIKTHSGVYAANTVYHLVFGILIGITLLWMLHKLNIRLSHTQTWSVILTEALLLPAAINVANYWVEHGMSNWAWTILFTAHGLGTGLLLTIILRKNGALIATRSALFTIFGWTMAFFSTRFFESLYSSVLQIINSRHIANLINFSIEAGIVGLVGGLFMVGQIRMKQKRRVNWLTVLAGFLGFGLGNLIANVFTAPMKESTFASSLLFLIWGLIGGTSLAVPSKNYKHYLVMGLLGGLGMMLGKLTSIALGDPDGIDKIITGLILGLFIGIRIKRVSAAFVLALMAITGYLLRTSLLTEYYYPSNLSMAAPTEFTFLALTAGLMGAIIGAAWSFVNRSESIPPEMQNTK